MANRKYIAPTGLGKRIQRIVDEQEMLKSDFARSLGVSPNYIYQIIAGRKTSISLSLAKLIEKMYGYPAGWVMGGDDREKR